MHAFIPRKPAFKIWLLLFKKKRKLNSMLKEKNKEKGRKASTYYSIPSQNIPERIIWKTSSMSWQFHCFEFYTCHKTACYGIFRSNFHSQIRTEWWISFQHQLSSILLLWNDVKWSRTSHNTGCWWGLFLNVCSWGTVFLVCDLSSWPLHHSMCS